MRTPLGTVLVAALAVAGCGLGPGSDVADVRLTVSTDYGRVVVLDRTVADLNESDTVIRVLDRSADVSTRYGGGFVQSIEGTEGGTPGGRPHDWFFYVNGVESPVGAAEYGLSGGESIWWDYRDWTAAMHVPAVVGSWPQPFAGGYDGRRPRVSVDCRGAGRACRRVRRRIEAVAGGGVFAAAEQAGGAANRSIRVLVGPWARLRSDPVASRIDRGPSYSGVFARFVGSGSGLRLEGLGVDGEAARAFGPGTGLVAATRSYGSPPVWVVTGAGGAGVRAAAGLLGRAGLRDRYAAIGAPSRSWGLPLQ